MSKEDKQEKTSYAETLKSLEKKRKQLEKEHSILKSKCDHKNKEGQFKLSPIKGGRVVCDRCGEVFDLKPITPEQLSDAIETVHNALQQVRCLAKKSESGDKDLIVRFGVADHDIHELESIYRKVLDKHASNKKKKKKHSNEYSYYGKNVSYLGRN